MKGYKVSKSIHIFCCYTHTDREFLDALKKHLQPLLRRGFIDLWSDTDIGPGMQWEEEINTHLEKANIILLLVSADFVSSDYCYSNELRKAMNLHFAAKARVVPIILRPVLWSMTEFGKLQALPTHAIPIASSSWSTPDDAYLDIVENVRRMVEELLGNDETSNQEVLCHCGRLAESSTDLASIIDFFGSRFDQAKISVARTALEAEDAREWAEIRMASFPLKNDLLS
jgi:TIR domain